MMKLSERMIGNLNVENTRGSVIYTNEEFRDLVKEVTQLEEDLQDAKIDKSNAERLRDNVFAENATLKRENEGLRDKIHDLYATYDIDAGIEYALIDFTGGTTPTYFSEQNKEKDNG